MSKNFADPDKPFDYKSVQSSLIRAWNENIQNGKDLERYIRSIALKPNLGNMDNLVQTLDEMPETEQSHFYKTILPQMASMAKFITSGPQSNLLARFKAKNTKLSLTRFEIACLLANAFLCTFPQDNNPKFSFAGLYLDSAGAPQREKIKCLINYFDCAFSTFDVGFFKEIVTYKRNIVVNVPDWEDSSKPMIPMNIVSKGSIADAHKMAQVNFSNRIIGGGVLDNTCLREEMWFITCPELIITKMFSQCMEDNEAITVTGVLQFSQFEGSGNTFKYLGAMADEAFRGPHTVVSIDALNFDGSVSRSEQYLKENVDRELLKAFAGFSGTKSGTVATGNWGGGCFCGNPILKGKIQNIAASQAEKALFYYPFNNQTLENQIEREVKLEEPSTVGDAYEELLEWCKLKIASSPNISPSKKMKL